VSKKRRNLADTQEHDVPQLHCALPSALAELLDSNRALRLCLEENEKLILKAQAMTDRGVNASTVLQEIEVYKAQVAADETMVALFDARDRVRKVVICEGLEDGMTVEQLAAMFHLSPDLISAYVAERSNKFSSASSQR
jgi:fructose-1,6-bisphosphatase